MNKKKHIGTFSTIEEAFRAYKKEKETCLKEYIKIYFQNRYTTLYTIIKY